MSSHSSKLPKNRSGIILRDDLDSYIDDDYEYKSIAGNTAVIYYPNNRVMYKGDFVNGKPHGKGSYYLPTGQLRYEGGWVKGVYSGFGKLYVPDKTDEPSGLGRVSFQVKVRYNGEFRDGCFRGKGTLYYPNGNVEFKGLFIHGQIDKEGGVSYKENGDIEHIGLFVHGRFNSNGEFIF